MCEPSKIERSSHKQTPRDNKNRPEVSDGWLHRIDPGDLSAALASVGAVDHPDTPERYLAKVRVWESGEAERERLRQQVAKFRV